MREIKLNSKLRDILKQRGIKFSQFAEEMGVTHRALNLWFRGCGISLDIALKISKRLGVSVEDIWEVI